MSRPFRQRRLQSNQASAVQPTARLGTALTKIGSRLAGVEIMPEGPRKASLRDALLALLDEVLPLFDGRILAFDARAAEAFAFVNARTRRAGYPIGFADGAITAIASIHRFTIATRNIRDFRETGIQMLSPREATTTKPSA